MFFEQTTVPVSQFFQYFFWNWRQRCSQKVLIGEKLGRRATGDVLKVGLYSCALKHECQRIRRKAFGSNQIQAMRHNTIGGLLGYYCNPSQCLPNPDYDNIFALGN
ncbi:hypothetical protein ACFLXE_00245 [Chloroflexota bacterium]